MSSRDFQSYAHHELSREEIINFSRQYIGINMAELIGADEAHFPFIIKDGERVTICFWESQFGIVMHHDEDPVKAYATQRYLRENAYPVFDSMEAAEAYAIAHNWPRPDKS